MKLLNDLIAINSQSQNQLRSAKFHISHHIIFLLKNAEWTFFPGGVYDPKRKHYTKNAQKSLISIIEQEYQVLVSAEKILNNLRGISEYYYFECLRLFKEYEIPINQFLLTKKLIEQIEVEEVKSAHSETEKKPSLIVKPQVDDIQTKKDYRLIFSATKGDREAVSKWIDAKVNLDIQDKDGNTALILAAICGHLEVARALIEAKANLNIQSLNGNTALIEAIELGYLEIAYELIIAKANLDIQNETDGNTALILAAGYGYLKIVRVLIIAKANLNIQSRERNTALHLALDKGHLEIAHELIAAKANLDLQDGKNGGTVLHCALHRNHQGIAFKLIRAKAALNIQDTKYGDTALILAAYKGYREIVKELIKAGALLDIKNKKEETAADIAIKKRDIPIVSLLLSNNPEKLFDFLESCDQRDHEVLVSLKELCNQLNAKLSKEKGSKVLHIKTTYLEKLTLLTETQRTKVFNELRITLPNIAPELLEIVAEYDSPLEADRLLFFQPSEIDKLLSAENKLQKSLDDRRLSKYFKEQIRNPLSWANRVGINYQDFKDRMSRLDPYLQQLVLTRTGAYTLPLAEEIMEILRFGTNERAKILLIDEQLAKVPDPDVFKHYLFLSDYGVIALKEGLITPEQAAKFDNYLGYFPILFSSNGCDMLREKLITPEQAAKIPYSRCLEHLLSDNGCQMLREGLIIADEIAEIRGEYYLKELFSDNGCQMLREGLITVKLAWAMPHFKCLRLLFSDKGCEMLRRQAITAEKATGLSLSELEHIIAEFSFDVQHSASP